MNVQHARQQPLTGRINHLFGSGDGQVNTTRDYTAGAYRDVLFAWRNAGAIEHPGAFDQ
jgi:hypothetical protein